MQNKYLIYDEFGQAMRFVPTKGEAEDVIAIRPGWTYCYVKPPTGKPQPPPDLGEALI